MNAVEIEEAVSRLAEQPFDAESFPYAFLEAFGNKPATIQRLKSGNTNQSDIGGMLQRSNIHLKTCAHGEVAAILKALRESPKTASHKAKFILATDGIEMQAEALDGEGETLACAYPDFADHFGFFLPLAGISTVRQIRENAFDIKATGRLNRLYIELLTDNPEWATAARREDLNHFMARLIFCFFAEDTAIFHGESLFTATIEQMTKGAPEITHEVISELFRAMNIPVRHAGKLDNRYREAARIKTWANVFPYVNGGLFSGSADVPVGKANGQPMDRRNDTSLASHSQANEDVGVPRVPRFSKMARNYLLHIGNLDWTKINPDIFGSMIQAVADDEERGALGMHYTSVPNILKVLNPLFLDELRAKLEEAGDNPRKLLNLRNRIARIRVFDPACGSGNFLVIAYKEMRAIEAEINRRRGEIDRRSDIPKTNFRGIELRHFSCEIARLALIIAEYQCDVLYRGKKLALAEFLPLDSANWITCGNALRLDWLSVCPPTGKGVKNRSEDLFETPMDQAEIDFENEGGETYICGNPPYLGRKYQTDEQKSELKSVFAGRCKDMLSLDYVSGWFMKGSEYMAQTLAEVSFVTTNSICQGIQVSAHWPTIMSLGTAIRFAYQSFKWSNLASHNAGVTVSIIGLTKTKNGLRKLFSVDAEDKITIREAI
ncbi:MAG: DNA methyltransferase, partial [Luteolibacter sp.]